MTRWERVDYLFSCMVKVLTSHGFSSFFATTESDLKPLPRHGNREKFILTWLVELRKYYISEPVGILTFELINLVSQKYLTVKNIKLILFLGSLHCRASLAVWVPDGCCHQWSLHCFLQSSSTRWGNF